MKKILTAKQIQEVDEITIKSQKITSTKLMEQAAKSCFNWIDNRLQGNPIQIKIFCGIGNNGGDGLAIARMLKKHGYQIETYVVNFSKNRSDDFLVNYKKLQELGVWPKMINSDLDLPIITENEMVIDAIFGIGLNRPAKEIAKITIEHINKSNAYVLSIDMPSGLFANKPVKDKTGVIRAFQTLTFEVPKLAFYLPENESFSVNTDIISIGLDTTYIQKLPSNYYIIEKNDIFKRLKIRSKFSHKGDFGHALIVGGSFGKIGAVTLASKSCLKIGAGLVTAYIPKCGYIIIQTAIPEVMVEVDAEKEIEYFNFKTKTNAIGIGVGMGKSIKTQKGFHTFLKTNKIPLVLDADALNIISDNIKWMKLLPKNSVLTPHPKELERLIGKWNDDYEKLKKMKQFSIQHNIIIVLKGHFTTICNQDKIYFNTTGNPSLATAGSGDVLTGIITGLLAQNYSAIDSCLLGVYIHGLTSDLALNEHVYETFTASDIIKYLPNAINFILKKES
jgi:hydroxyethylthiazole kinase-like uncharacterized protein yjeF